MQEILIRKLHDYIILNNMDLLISLQQAHTLSGYLAEKVATAEHMISELQSQQVPSYIIEERCLDFITQDLRPSKFNYISSVLETDFEKEYENFRENGTLTYEIINMIEACEPVFNGIALNTENEDNRHLRYAVTGTIAQYLGR